MRQGVVVAVVVASMTWTDGVALAQDFLGLVKSGDTVAVGVLVSNKAGYVNSRDKDGLTGLHVASSRGDIAMAGLLISGGALVDARAYDGSTPLHAAAAANSGEVVALLLSRGADISSKNKDGLTPLQLAEKVKAEKAAGVLKTSKDALTADAYIDYHFREAEMAFEQKNPERSYRILTALLRKQPGSERINSALGMTCMAMEDYSRAQMSFERALMINPGNDRVRLELARALTALRQYEAARQEFLRVLSRNPPPSVRKNVEKYLSEIQKGPARTIVSCRVDIGWLSDDNVNVGPDSDTVTISPITFGSLTLNTLDIGDSSKPAKANGMLASVALSAVSDLGAVGGWLGAMDVAWYENWLGSENETNKQAYYLASLGMRYVGSSTTVQLPITGTQIMKGNEPLLASVGLSPSVTFAEGAGRSATWTVSGTYESRDYDTLNDRDGDFVSLGGTYRRYYGGRQRSVYMGVVLSHDYTKKQEYEYEGVAWQLGGEFLFPSSTALYWKMKRSTADYKKKETLAPETRKDTQMQYTAGVNQVLGKRMMMDANYQFTDADSTFGLYQYTRSVVTVTMSYLF